MYDTILIKIKLPKGGISRYQAMKIWGQLKREQLEEVWEQLEPYVRDEFPVTDKKRGGWFESLVKQVTG